MFRVKKTTRIASSSTKKAVVPEVDVSSDSISEDAWGKDDDFDL